ncbi:MAG: TrmH family RNA methyltransferase [Beutenbergiaceae bacterium]
MTEPAPSGGPEGVGVPPLARPWPDDDRLDPELLAAGDRRNVADEFRYWRLDAIVAELNTRRHRLHIAIENWGHDFNIGSVVRTANAMNVAAVHIIGRRRWNRRGAMVTDRYLEVAHHPDVEGLASWAARAQLPLLGIDNVDGSEPLEGRRLPQACVLVFGEESGGLTAAARQACEAILHITQYGSTRSINAGAAAAIAMWAWANQHASAPPT